MPDKKKLVYVVTKSSWGGAQRYVYDLAQSFKDDFEVEIWCGPNELGTQTSLINKGFDAGIRVRCIKDLGRDINLKRELRVWQDLYRMIKIHKPDILHLNSTKVGGFGAVIGRLCKVKKIISTVHGLANFEDRPYWQIFLIDRYNRFIFPLMDRVIFLSKMEAQFTKNWLKASKSKIIYNGVVATQKLPQEQISQYFPQHIKVKFDAPDITKFVGVGELHTNKGIRYALAAFQKLKASGFDFIYVHFGEGELRRELSEQVKDIGLEEHVYFFGFKDNASAYLSCFDCLVFPSIKEGLPYAVLEAGFAGIPVFASRVGGIPEIIIDGKTGRLHDAKDVVSLTQHLKDFVDDRYYNKNIIRQRIFNEFSCAQMVRNTRQVYDA
jgi:glycosyltransferase involved in cell wall biosynthesis